MYKRIFFVGVGLLLLAACADPTGSPADAPNTEFAAVAQAAGENGGDVGAHILRHAESAPRLERYQLSFWAVRGEESRVQIRYLGGDGRSTDGEAPLADGAPNSTIDGSTFLWLHIPRYALEYHPDGTEIGWGERVLITIAVHPERFFISMQPSGLTFNSQNLPWLYLSYNGADPDFDGNGTVDLVDAYVEENFLSLWSFAPSRTSSAVDGLSGLQRGGGSKPKQVKKNKILSGNMLKFSDVAVSW